jgi:hypothetical protein
MVPSATAGPVTITLHVMGRAGSSLSLVVNGQTLPACDFTGGWRDCAWALPAGVLRIGANNIALRASKAARPADEGTSGDRRVLGVAVRSIRLAHGG